MNNVPQSQPYVLSVANISDQTEKVILFDKDFVSENILIECPNMEYKSILSMFDWMNILRILQTQVTSEALKTHPELFVFTIKTTDENGNCAMRTMVPYFVNEDFRDGNANIFTKFALDKFTVIGFKLPPHSKVLLKFYPGT